MLGRNSGVATRILQIQPRAHLTHCHTHSLSLGIKDVTKSSKILSNTMDTAEEITTLIKYSPKRECLLGQIKENLEHEDEGVPTAAGILSLCPTRWTVRASCFRRILHNYSALMEEWKECLADHLQPDVIGRIVGCQAQMQTFNFFFGLSFGESSHSDNLSKTLQSKKMSAVSGQRLAYVSQYSRAFEMMKAFQQCFVKAMITTFLSQFFPESVERRQGSRWEVNHQHFLRPQKIPSPMPISEDTIQYNTIGAKE
ncbi:Uncharacterised protein r2_g3115 [Pycnogonum litorale]